MHKKDYTLIAQAIREAREQCHYTETVASEAYQLATLRIARILSTKLHAENPRFNCQLFIEACGIVLSGNQ